MKVRITNERQTLLRSLAFSISSKAIDAVNQADNIIASSSRNGVDDYGKEQVVDAVDTDNAMQQLTYPNLLKLAILLR